MSDREMGDGETEAETVGQVTRMIDRWFPCAEVDAAVLTPAGSGRSEKALFTWFASRPIAQARAAVLTALLPDDLELRDQVRKVVLSGDPRELDQLAERIRGEFPDGPPVVLDVFSGRAMLPLEGARVGARAVGTDLSPVATLGGRLLADFPLRDWSAEPPLPFDAAGDGVTEDPSLFDSKDETPRLVADVKALLDEVGRRTRERVSDLYPRNSDLTLPWAYLWAITIPCENCSKRFPLVSSWTLRHPRTKTQDPGQYLTLVVDDDTWKPSIQDGVPSQPATFSVGVGRQRGKSARCIHCGHIHSLDTVKAKGFAGEYEDALLAVVSQNKDGLKVFRTPTIEEVAASNVDLTNLKPFGSLTAVPNEPIPAGNNNTVGASAYGYGTYGSLMNPRQSRLFVETAHCIREVHEELVESGISTEYAAALTGYVVANLQRQCRLSTRGAKLRTHGSSDGSKSNTVQTDHIFSNQSIISFGFDYLEVGPGNGPGTWSSVAKTCLTALQRAVIRGRYARPATTRRASAIALPFRDNSVDAVVTDPPYYDMITYADSSDLFYVWFKRVLFDIMPDLFGEDSGDAIGLQDKTDEIIVKGRGAVGVGDHRADTGRFERLLEQSFVEAKRVLKPEGHLVVVFGHNDPAAWERLLRALNRAGFVVTSSWPSRTETAATGVASIKVTVTIGCQVAPGSRQLGMQAVVDREVGESVGRAVREWDADGLALTDQLMAAYGPAMAVYGRYAQVIDTSGAEVDVSRYLGLARAAVRDATALRLDELPLETFDPKTRFAVFWNRIYGRSDVPKGEARFLAQADSLKLEDLRGSILLEKKSGFVLRVDDPGPVEQTTSSVEVVRAMASAWASGGTDAVAGVVADSERAVNDPHLWAIVGEFTNQLPQSDPVARALTAIKRNQSTVSNLAARTSASNQQLTLADATESEQDQ